MSNTRQVAETAGQSAMTTDGYGFASSATVWTDVRDAGGVPRYAQASARSWEELLFLFGVRRVDGGGVELAKPRGVVVWGHFGPVRDRAKRQVGQDRRVRTSTETNRCGTTK